MKKVRLIIFLLLFVSLSLSAFEGGGIVKTGIDIGFDKDKANFSNFNGLSLWAKQNMDKEGNYNFSAQISYLLNLKKPIKPNKKLEMTHILNLDMLKFSFLIPITKDSLSIDIGRYSLSDITGIILNQNIDGIYLTYSMPRFSTAFNLGYTGLLNTYVNPTTASGVKALLSGKSSNISKHLPYKLSPSFVAFYALVHIPFGSLRHALDLDLNSFIATADKGATNNYASLAVSGPIVSNLFYLTSVSGSLLTRKDKGNQMGFFASGELNYYFKKYASKIGLKTQWFSGGKNSFKSFTLSNLSKVNFVEAKDVWKTGLNASMKPIPDLFLSTSFDTMTHASKKYSFFRGFEWSASAIYTILQDISISTDVGIIVGNKGSVYTRAALKGTISF